MIGNKIGHRLDPYLYAILKNILGEHGNPNFFTLMGFFATLAASILNSQGILVLRRIGNHPFRTFRPL